MYKWLIDTSPALEDTNLQDIIAAPNWNLAAGMIMIASIWVLTSGKEIGKTTMNVITSFKILLITFMTIVAFVHWDASNLDNGFPVPMTETGSSLALSCLLCFFINATLLR